MKRILIIALLAVLILPAQTQDRTYRKAMAPAIERMNNASDPAGELGIAATFEQIAQKFPDQWLPFYHAGRILVINSFTDNDVVNKDAFLERAKKSLDQALTLAPRESEVHALEALYYMGLISVDPISRGEMYYQDALVAIRKSKELDPDNPRAWYLDGLMILNMPEFLGGGPEPAKPIFAEAAEKFKTFRNDDPYWPSWGEELNQSELDKLK